MWVGTSNGAFLFLQKDNMRKVHMISQFQGRMVTVFFCDAEGAIYAGLRNSGRQSITWAAKGNGISMWK